METVFWTEAIWWIGVVMGLLGGFLIAYLLLQKRSGELLKLLAEAKAKAATTESLLFRKESEWRDQQERYGTLEQDFQQQSQAYARLQEGHQQLQTRMEERISEVAQLQEQFTLHFQNVSQKIVESNAKKLSEDHQERLFQVLNPLKERLETFEQKVQNAYEVENRERFSLRKEIEKLVTLNNAMSEEAKNLTRALKGESKTQGNWGELVLTRVLESSGLREGEEYIPQGKDMGLRDEDGKLRQPDVVVKLPENKHLLIDAKVSLTAYERFSSAADDDQRLSAINEHLISVRRHVQQLSDKHYAQLAGINSPEFVLMFMPIEPAFHLSVQSDSDLYNYAWDRKIVLVSPTTLLATLRTVSSVWKMERRNHNAEEIARLGGALYDKLVGFVQEVESIGTHLDRAVRSQQQAMNKLRDGKGSLTSRAETLKELDIKNRKELGG